MLNTLHYRGFDSRHVQYEMCRVAVADLTIDQSDSCTLHIRVNTRQVLSKKTKFSQVHVEHPLFLLRMLGSHINYFTDGFRVFHKILAYFLLIIRIAQLRRLFCTLIAPL